MVRRPGGRCSMASGGYYYDQSTGYGYLPAPRATPFHLLVFLVNITLLGATSLYSRYESAAESLVDQVRFAIILSPLLLLLAVKYWAATARSRRLRGGALSSITAGRGPAHLVRWRRMGPAPAGWQLGGGIVVAVERGAPGRCDFNKHTC